MKEIILPYVAEKRKELKLPNDQKALLIFDVFTGQMTSVFNVFIEENDMVSSHVSNNMTSDYQTLNS